MSWKGILGKAGVSLTGPNGANDWTFEGAVHARNIISRFAGQHFHVDSGSLAASDSAKYGKRKEKPFATIDYAVGQCTANDGDVIWAHSGHIEAIVAAGGLDLDVEGITIVFLGNGNDQAKITFGTDVDADMDVDADNVTLINPRFESAIDALTGPIDVNKANFTIFNGEYYDAANKAATDCIVAIAAAKGLTIDGWKYFESTTGTQKESNIQLNGVDDLTLKNIDIRGDFDSSNIENITDELLNVRFEDIYLDNLAPGPVACMKLDSNCDGFAQNVNCRVYSGTTYLSDDSDINWGPNCRGYSADGGSGEPLGTSPAGDIEAKIDVIDGYHDVPTKDAATNLYLRDVVGIKTDSAAAGAVSEVESLMAYIKQAITLAIARDTAIGVVDGLHDAPTKDAATDLYIRDVVGRKTDTGATGAVSEVESIMAYVKQAVTEGITRDAVIGALNTAAATGAVTDADLIMGYVKQLVTEGIARDGVIGALNTAAAAGAVTDADLMMAYIKQLVTLAIARDTAIETIDGLHDVPIADAATNLYMRDVVGIKTDAAAAGAVSSVESLMAYVKQAVTLAIARDTAIGIIDEFHDVPAADNVLNAQINEVIGNKSDAAAADAVTATDTLVGYIKQLVTAAVDGVVIAADGITAAKIGDAAFSDEHFDVDATGKLVAGTIVTKATGAIAGVGDTNLFTVANGLVMITSLTGEVTAQIGADQDHTLKHGTTDLAALLVCDADAVGTLYAITGNPGDVLVEGNNAGAKGQVTPIIVNAGTIKLTVAGATFAGEITWRLNYVPLEAGATVTTA